MKKNRVYMACSGSNLGKSKSSVIAKYLGSRKKGK